MSICFCPHCGFNLAPDKALVSQDFVLYPAGLVWYKGNVLPFTKQEAQVWHSIAAARGRPITSEVIGNRVSEGDNPSMVVMVCLSNTKRKVRNLKTLKSLDIPFPIGSQSGVGYYWKFGDCREKAYIDEPLGFDTPARSRNT